MKRRTRSPPTTSASRTSTSGSTSARRASISAWIVLIFTSSIKKRALRPLPRMALRPRKACGFRVAVLGRLTGAVAVDPVVAPLGIHARGEGQRLACLGGAAELHERAPEAEQRVVVGRRALDHRLELRAGALEVAAAEMRAAERLADGGLVGLEIARLAQRDDGGVEVP